MNFHFQKLVSSAVKTQNSQFKFMCLDQIFLDFFYGFFSLVKQNDKDSFQRLGFFRYVVSGFYIAYLVAY